MGKRYKMFSSHGPDWVAWQEVWLESLRKLRDRDVVIVADSINFKEKFLTPSDDFTNARNHFDAKYELSEGERATNILDWERRHICTCADQNKLRIVFINEYKQGYNEEFPVMFLGRDKVNKPDWYPLPLYFGKKTRPDHRDWLTEDGDYGE